MLTGKRNRPFELAWVAMTQMPAVELIDMPAATGRRRLLGGKSARLLHLGDEVALSDLVPDRNNGTSTAIVAEAFVCGDGSVLVKTFEHGLFVVPGARLLLARRQC